MSRLILPTIFGGVFLVVGLALLILPARVLYNWYSRMRHRQYERLRMVWGDRIGDWLYNRFGSRDIGLKNTATLYRIMGGFVVAFMLCWYTAFASAVIRDAGGLDGTGTVIYEGPIVSAGTSAYLYPNRYPQPKTMNATYPFGTQEVYDLFR